MNQNTCVPGNLVYSVNTVAINVTFQLMINDSVVYESAKFINNNSFQEKIIITPYLKKGLNNFMLKVVALKPDNHDDVSLESILKDDSHGIIVYHCTTTDRLHKNGNEELVFTLEL
jgi:hypothetical protein